MPPRKILCVAEKNSVAKAVAGHLGGGQVTTHGTRSQYIKNYEFEFDFGPPWGRCSVTMTSVSGHLTELVFGAEYKDWRYPPPQSLFEAPVSVNIDNDKKAIADNIEGQARYAQALFIWTDCDREGEHIGGEVRASALKRNARLEVKRAWFSNIERAHVIRAAKNPINLDDRQVDAVAARIELDLRIGFAFTRLQTLCLRELGGQFERGVYSYGSCQFPTLGFVVDRYFQVKNFVSEPFWAIKVVHRREDKNVTFLWSRVRLFDRTSVTILYERCLRAKRAKVVKVEEKPTSRWRPLPLTTVELQKMASKLRMTGQQAMTVAEALYQKGFISYPRTETDRFDRGINLRNLVEKQIPDNRWGQYAQGLLNGGFKQPREGRHDDKAHPPIHPIAYANPTALRDDNERRVYEFVARRFLACCSEDAKGAATIVEIEYGEEKFHARGLIVLERNYLDVYPYENWTSSQVLPRFILGEQFEPTEAWMTDGKTSPPGYLTEPDLIALMDANGIGTDATMAEHIQKIKDREYVETRMRGVDRGDGDDENASEPEEAPAGRGNGRGRGRGGGRGRGRGRGGGGGGGGARRSVEFIPTTLGVALIKGYDNIGFETSLSKPFLRKEMELSMKDICEGRKTRHDVVEASIAQYRQVFMRSQANIGILKAAARQYVLGDPNAR